MLCEFSIYLYFFPELDNVESARHFLVQKKTINFMDKKNDCVNDEFLKPISSFHVKLTHCRLKNLKLDKWIYIYILLFFYKF